MLRRLAQGSLMRILIPIIPPPDSNLLTPQNNCAHYTAIDTDTHVNLYFLHVYVYINELKEYVLWGDW